MHLITFVTVLSFPLTWASPCSPSKPPTPFTVGQAVDTSSGLVTGHASAKLPNVSEYLGIPYGQPPVGDLRFSAPLKYSGSAALNGSSFGFACPSMPTPQGPPPSPEVIAFSNVTAIGLELFNVIGNSPVQFSEDCLTLNVWSKLQLGEAKKAVLVYIHGGGFTGGTSALPIFDGAPLVEREDVVIVTLNYRLSILGFPGNPNSQGNLAFLDQRLAMEWVRDNISNFGGDTSRITLFGQSAGGASTDYYSYAFAADPIAAGIIEQSGTAFSFGLPYLEDTAASAWYTVTSTLGCGDASTDPSTLLACMRTVDFNSVLRAVPNTGLSAIMSPFGPTVDNTLVFANYSQQTPASIPILLGSDDYEAGITRTQLAMSGATFPDADWEELNDSSYNCPVGRRANASIAFSNPTWRYRYHGIFPNTNISLEGGAYHGAELQLIFGTTFSDPASTPEEVEFESYIQGAWTAFAKDPINGLTAYGWPTYDPAGVTLVRLALYNAIGTNLAFPAVYDSGCATASLSALVCRVFGQCELPLSF